MIAQITRTLQYALVIPLLVAVWLYADISGALAADETEYGIRCEQGQCTVELGNLNGVGQTARSAAYWLEIAEDHVNLLPEGVGVEFTDELTIHAPQGILNLVDSDLMLRVGEDGEFTSLQGRAKLNTSRFESQGDGADAQPTEWLMGYMPGDDLPEIDVAILPEQRYFYVHAATDLRAIGQNLLGTEPRTSSLEVPEGQQATLVVDPTGPWLFVDGNFVLHRSGYLDIVEALSNPDLTLLDWQNLPVPSTMGVAVSGLLTPSLDEAYLRLYGGYEVHAGQLGQWLNLDEYTLMTQGVFALDSTGVLMDGEAYASILPEQLIDSDVQLAVFIPFDKTLRDSYVHFRNQTDLPLAGISIDRSSVLDGQVVSQMVDSWTMQWASDEEFAVGDVSEPEAIEMDSSLAESVPVATRISMLSQETLDGVKNGSKHVYHSTQQGLKWTGNQIVMRSVGVASGGWLLVGK